MKAKLNRQLLKTTNFDSGSLGMLAMVLHQFNTEGYYKALIKLHDKVISTIGFHVQRESEKMQLDIDLAMVVRGTNIRSEKCSHHSEVEAKRVVSPEGYVLFHASFGNGFSVLILNDNDKVIFDSTKLNEGSLFAVSLLEPTNYLISNILGSAKGDIAVNLNRKSAQSLKTIETCYVDISEKSLEPKHIELISSQGLVFRIKGLARIVIKKKSDSKVKGDKHKVHWQKQEINREKSK